MKPHPRIRKTIKWGGVAVTVLLVVVWIGSGWRREYSAVSGRWDVFLLDGRVVVTKSSQPVIFADRQAFLARKPASTFSIVWGIDLESDSITWALYIPMWIPSLAVMLLALFAWRVDLLAHCRAKLNLCTRCGYDRAGILKDAKCPECGAVPASA